MDTGSEQDQDAAEYTGPGVVTPMYHDDKTLNKVLNALSDAGLTEQQVLDAVNSMQNAGIYFRESPREK